MTSVASPPTGEAAGGGAPPRLHESLSQLAARILDQLSVSAWLPSGVLVSLVLVVGAIRHSGGDLHAAAVSITSMHASTLVLLTAAVILTTTLTQAFEFESIRLLEGYWGAARVSSLVSDAVCRLQRRRRRRLRDRLAHVERSAFQTAKEGMSKARIPQDQIDVVESDKGYRDGHHASKADIAAARNINWRDFADSRDIRRLEALSAALALYPTRRPILPTRLGNTLRSYEERVGPAANGQSLEGFVQREFHELPATLQIEHDQFRQRLDLYCSLVVVFLLTGGVAFAAFWRLGVHYVLIATASACALSWLSYRAAIASGRAYGAVLETIATRISRADDQR